MDKIKERIKNRSIIIAFFVFTVFLYGPYSIFLPNAEEIWFTLSMLTKIVLPVSTIIFIVLLIISGVVPDDKQHIFTKLLFGFALAMYIQGNYINISYGVGVQNGSEIVWSDYTWYAIVDTLVWIFCFAVPFIVDAIVKRNNKKFYTAIIIASLFFTIIQIPAFIVQAITFNPNESNEINITTDNIFEVSDSENILIFMLDTLQGSYYDTFISLHPEYKENLKGFVHYDNTSAAGAATIVAVPAMFTGEPFTRQETYSEYLNNVWSSENLFSLLNDAGYEVDVYSESVLFSPNAIDYIDNFEFSNGEVLSWKILTEKVYKMDLYKFAPHLLKPHFWYTSEELNEAKVLNDSYVLDDHTFYDLFSENGFIVDSSKKKTLQLYHLEGAHAPYDMDEYGNKVKSTCEQQVAGSFYCLAKIFDDMKAKDIYDNSTIIIMADHGDNSNLKSLTFLVKESGATGGYRTSSAPVSGFDVAPYIASLAGKKIENSVYSGDLTKLDENTVRERHFFHNTSGNSRLQIVEYASTGTIHDKWLTATVYDDSWSINIPVNIGEVLSFREEATANRYTVEGFGNNTGFRTRLFGPYAKMQMRIANLPKKQDLKAHFEIYNSLPKSSKSIIVEANGVKVFEGEINKKLLSDGLDFPIPRDSFEKDNILTLEFYFPDLDDSEMNKSVKKRTETISFCSFIIEKQ